MLNIVRSLVTGLRKYSWPLLYQSSLAHQSILKTLGKLCVCHGKNDMTSAHSFSVGINISLQWFKISIVAHMSLRGWYSCHRSGSSTAQISVHILYLVRASKALHHFLTSFPSTYVHLVSKPFIFLTVKQNKPDNA